MTTSRTLPATGTASSFNTFSLGANSPLIGKINGLFEWTVACFAAGAVSCLYTLYQAYQFSKHTAFGLDDNFKIVKCNALLLEANEPMENIQPLLQQCEALLASITGAFCSSDKKELLLKLVEYYAKTDPDHAYSIAQRMTSSNCLFNAAQSIQHQNPDFDKTKLSSLYQRADAAREQEYPNLAMLLGNLVWSLQLAKAYATLKNSEAANICYVKAHNLKESYFLQDQPLANSSRSPLAKMRELCSIAQSFHEIKDPNGVDAFIDAAKKLMAEMPQENIIQAHLVLAGAYLDVKNFKAMDQEFQEVTKYFIEDNSIIHKNLYTFAKLIQKISESDTFSDFRDYNFGAWAQRAFEGYICSLDGKEQAEAYLNLASLYQDVLVDKEYPASENCSRETVYNVIKALPESSKEEITSKVDLLCKLLFCYKKDRKMALEILKELERLHALDPLEDDAGLKIVMLYNAVGLADESQPFFQKHISDIVTQKDTKAFAKITNLALYGGKISPFNEAQKKAALEAAEKLLPQLEDRYERSMALANIAKGYLQVDRQRSLAILADLEDRQAKNCKFIAGVTAIATASLYFDPAVGSLLFLGAGVLRLYPSLISYVY